MDKLKSAIAEYEKLKKEIGESEMTELQEEQLEQQMNTMKMARAVNCERLSYFDWSLDNAYLLTWLYT